MDILTQVEQDYITALKAKNELTVSVLRQIKSALANAVIVKNREPLTGEEVLKVLRAEVKKRREAAELYRQGGRPELAEKETNEIEIVEQYLPAQMSAEAIETKVSEVIAKMGVTSSSDAGKVIGAVMKELASAADGSKVGAIVKKLLSGR
ncbi:MAG: GatB/YqeY domain-containing protein [Patescibacteria group bacterium]|nr:GatB/YqeY domain-containing protein [Patescibacteria group bacterium]